MHNKCLRHLVSPITHEALYQKGRKLYTLNKAEVYHVVRGVPILLDDDTSADWHREIMEVLLWQYPAKIDVMYTKVDWSTFEGPSKTYIEYISALLKNKEGILSAVHHYSRAKTDQWIIHHRGTQPVSSEAISAFKKHNNKKRGATKLTSVRNNGEDQWATYLPRYVEQVHSGGPSVLLELSTGSGFGTAAVADQKQDSCTMYTMDISFDCHGNAAGIAKYLHISDTLFPVCANFWHMPFADESVDAVCSNFGLDESREMQRTIAEVSRVLKTGGRFVNVSRSNASLRSFNLFEPFGFTREETVEVIKTARIYSDTESLIDECEGHGLTLREKYDFQASNEQTREVTVSTFIRERTT